MPRREEMDIAKVWSLHVVQLDESIVRAYEGTTWDATPGSQT